MEGAAAVLVGLLLGMACGGTPRRLSSARLRWEYPTIVVFLAQAAVRASIGGANLGSMAWYLWAVLATILTILLIVQTSGALRLVALGVGLNVVVVLVNGGMPVWAHSLVGSSLLDAVRSSGGFYTIADVRGVLVFLGDVLPTPWGAVGSVGDMALIVGVVTYLVINLTRPTSEAD